MIEYEKEQQHLIEGARQALELKLKSAEDEVTRIMQQLSEKTKRVHDHEQEKWQHENQAELWRQSEETYKSEVEGLKKDIKAANEELKRRQDLYKREISITSEQYAVKIKEMEQKITEEAGHVETLSTQLDELQKAKAKAKAKEKDSDDYKRLIAEIDKMEERTSALTASELELRKKLKEKEIEIRKLQQQLSEMTSLISKKEEKVAHGEVERLNMEDQLKQLKEEKRVVFKQLSEQEHLAGNKEKDLLEQLKMAVAANEALRVESQREIGRFKKEQEVLQKEIGSKSEQLEIYLKRRANEVRGSKKAVAAIEKADSSSSNDQCFLNELVQKLQEKEEIVTQLNEQLAGHDALVLEWKNEVQELTQRENALKKSLSEYKVKLKDGDDGQVRLNKKFEKLRKEFDENAEKIKEMTAAHRSQQEELNKKLKELLNEKEVLAQKTSEQKQLAIDKESQWAVERQHLHKSREEKERGVIELKKSLAQADQKIIHLQQAEESAKHGAGQIALELEELQTELKKQVLDDALQINKLRDEKGELVSSKNWLTKKVETLINVSEEERRMFRVQLEDLKQSHTQKEDQWIAERERLHDENQQKANEVGVLKIKHDRVALELQTLQDQKTRDISRYQVELDSLLQKEKALTATKSHLEQEKAQISEHNDELRALIEKQSEDMKQQAIKLSELQRTKDVALSFEQQLRHDSHIRQLEGHPHSLRSSPDCTLRAEQIIESASVMNSLQGSGMAIVQDEASPLLTQSEVSSRMPERRGHKRGANAQFVPVRKSPRLALVVDTTRQHQFNADESTDGSDNLSDSESREMNSDDPAAQESLPSSPAQDNVVTKNLEKRGHKRGASTAPVLIRKSSRLARVAEITQEAQPDDNDESEDIANDVEESAVDTELMSQELMHALSLMGEGFRVQLGVEYMKQRMTYPNLPELLDKSPGWTPVSFRYAVYKFNQRTDMLNLNTLISLRSESKEYYNAVSDYLVYFKPVVRELAATWNDRRVSVPVPGNGVFLSESIEKWSRPHFNFMLWQRGRDHFKANILDVLTHMFKVINPVEIQDDYNRLIRDYLMFSFRDEEGDIDLTSEAGSLMLKRAVRNIQLRNPVVPVKVQGKRFYFNEWNTEAVKEYLTRYGVTFLLGRTKTRGEFERLKNYAESSDVDGYKVVLQRIGNANGYKYSEILGHYCKRNKKERNFPFIAVKGLTLDTQDAATLFLTFAWAFGLSKKIVTPAGRDSLRSAFRKINRHLHPELYQQLMILVARTYQKPERFMNVMKGDDRARPDNQAWTIENASEMMTELLLYEQNKESR